MSYQQKLEAYRRQVDQYNRDMQAWHRQHKKYMPQGINYRPYGSSAGMNYQQLSQRHNQIMQGDKFLRQKGGLFDHVKAEQKRQHDEWKKKRGGWKKWLAIGGAIAGAMFIPGAQAFLGKALGKIGLGGLGKGAGKIGLKGVAKGAMKSKPFWAKAAGAAAKTPLSATYGMKLPGITKGAGPAIFKGSKAAKAAASLGGGAPLSGRPFNAAKNYQFFAGGRYTPQKKGFFRGLGRMFGVTGQRGAGGFRQAQGGWNKFYHGMNMYGNVMNRTSLAYNLARNPGMAVGMGMRMAGSHPGWDHGWQGGGGWGGFGHGMGMNAVQSQYAFQNHQNIQNYNAIQERQRFSNIPQNMYIDGTRGVSSLQNPQNSANLFMNNILSPRRAASNVQPTFGYGGGWGGHMPGQRFESWM